MLDMLVVCVEAGLGLNQALVRVADEIDHVSRVMSEQLALVNLEMRAGTPRDEALKNLAERTGLADMKSLVSMLVQTDRFGTSVADALRVHSDTMRTKRRQRAEEAAAKTDDQAGLSAGALRVPGDVRGGDRARRSSRSSGCSATLMRVRLLRVVNTERRAVLGTRVGLADGWLARLRGLLGRAGARRRAKACCSRPCGSVHMLGMRLPARRGFSRCRSAGRVHVTPRSTRAGTWLRTGAPATRWSYPPAPWRHRHGIGD